jgi:hypothetical protein
VAPSASQEEKQMMSIAAGGNIKQAIIPDTYPDEIWRTDCSTFFNIQLVNSGQFRKITGLSTPPTPVTYEKYIEAGIPFYSILNEPNSTISGDFGCVKSLAKFDHASDLATSNHQDSSEQKEVTSERYNCAICHKNDNFGSTLV